MPSFLKPKSQKTNYLKKECKYMEVRDIRGKVIYIYIYEYNYLLCFLEKSTYKIKKNLGVAISLKLQI